MSFLAMYGHLSVHSQNNLPGRGSRSCLFMFLGKTNRFQQCSEFSTTPTMRTTQYFCENKSKFRPICCFFERKTLFLIQNKMQINKLRNTNLFLFIYFECVVVVFFRSIRKKIVKKFVFELCSLNNNVTNHIQSIKKIAEKCKF
jgi:hypothetical protein